MTRSSATQFGLLAVAWGGSYVFIKIALDGLAPGQLVLGRLVLGGIFMLVIARMRGVGLPSSVRTWAHIAVTAVLGMVVPFLLLAWGEQHTSSAMAGVLISASPLITLAIAALALREEKVSARKVLGFIGGFAGVLVVSSPWQADTGSRGGQLAVLGAALCYALQAVYVRKFLSTRGIAPLASSTSQVLAAAVLQLVITPFLPWRTPELHWPVVLSVVVLATICTGLGYLLFFRLIGELGATTTSAVIYLVPIVAMALGVLLLGEQLTATMLIGSVIVLASLAVAENRLRLPTARRGRTPPAALADAGEGRPDASG